MAGQAGSGLVLDTRTGLRWLRFRGPVGQTRAQAKAYCADRGLRLPTSEEAGAISEAAYCKEAWPEGWSTWTAIAGADGKEPYAYHSGKSEPVRVDYRRDALCVR